VNGARRGLARARNVVFGFSCASMIMAGGALAEGTYTPEYPPLEPRILSSPTLGPVPGDFANWSELFAMQERLNAAARQILADPAAAANLAGIIAAPDERHLQVFWKGETPASTRALLAQLRRDVPIVVRAARYSRAELLAAHQRVMQEPHVMQANPKTDGSGLDVVFDERHTDTILRAALSRRVDALLAGIPARYSSASPSMAVASRDASARPPFSGSRIIGGASDGSACSLGAPVYLDNVNDGLQTYGWLTARHCTGPVGTRIYNTQTKSDKKSSVIGTMRHSAGNTDAAFIEGSPTKARLFVGRPFEETASVPIGGSSSNFEGNLVFTSGSATGLNGALRVLSNTPSITEEAWVCKSWEDTPDGFRTYDGAANCVLEKKIVTFYNVARAEHIRGLAAVGDGDSGGVAFSFLPDGRALVRGVIARKGKARVDCPAEHRVPMDGANAVHNFCSSEVQFVDWDALVSLGVVSGVLTGTWN
jgi:hypothetical protein